MAHRSLSPVGDECPGPEKWTPELDWKLINCEPAEEENLQSDCPPKGKELPDGPGPSNEGCDEEEEEKIADWSHINVESAVKKVRYKHCSEIRRRLYAGRNPGWSRFKNGEQNPLGELNVDGVWHPNKAETSDGDLVSQFRRSLRSYRFDLDEAGPSTDHFHVGDEEAGPTKSHFRNDWMQLSAEAPAQDSSSASGQHGPGETSSAEDHSLPGPSRTKKYATILKKSNSDRQAVDEDWKLINIEEPDDALAPSWSDGLGNSTDCGQASQNLKLSYEKETKKHVHFDPRSECDMFDLCDDGAIETDSFMDVYGTAVINYGESATCSLLGLSPKDMLPSDLNAAETVTEKIKFACENDSLQSKFSLAINRNSSANNDPKENSSEDRESHPTDPVNREKKPAFQQPTSAQTMDSLERKAGASDIPEPVRYLERASKSVNDVGSPDYRRSPTPLVDEAAQLQAVPRIGTKSQSRTERMVALFTNLQAQQTSPPLPCEKIRRRKLLDGIVTDHDERRVETTEETNPASVAEKIQKVERVISPPRHSRAGSPSPSGSPRQVHGLEYEKTKNEGLRHTNKQSVEAILVVLQSMRSILVRMAKMGTSANVDGSTGQGQNSTDIMDILKPQRKKPPYKFNCPKDREVMPDGLFAYSIAHQVVGQAFKKIAELYPDCANRVQTDSDSGKEFRQRDSASTLLALTAMKDALRDLEGSGADKSYISTAVETSDSLTNIPANNTPEEEQLQESYPADESKKIVLSLINEIIFEIDKSVEAKSAKARNDDSMGDVNSVDSSSDVELKQSDRLEAELKQMSFELVSRTMREAVSALTSSNAPCNKSQIFATHKRKEAVEGKADTETSREAPDSAAVAESAHQRDEQSVAYFMQSISNEVHELISKLFYHLQSVDSREELNAIITGAEVDPHTSAERFANTASKCSAAESGSDVVDSSAAEEGAADDTTAGINGWSTQRQDKSITFGMDTSVDRMDVGEQHKPVSNENDAHKNCKTEFLSPGRLRVEQRKQSQDLYPCGTDGRFPGRNNSQESVLMDELCQSNDSTKCVNSSSQTTDSSMEHLFEMHVTAAPRPHVAPQNNQLHSPSRQQSLEYSTPSTLLRMRAFDDRRETDLLGSTGFGSLHFGRSSDALLIPTATVHMTGGNHPEHVQQADQNRPSCSSSARNQVPLHNPQVSQRSVTSRSVTATLDATKRQGCWNCGGPCYHQQRVAKLGNAPRNRRSFSEPKLDFYKRTKALECPRVRRQLFERRESDNSEWTVIGYYPPRPFSVFAATNTENIEYEDDDVYTVEFGEGVTQTEAQVIFGIMAASVPHSTADHPARAASASVDAPCFSNTQGFASTAGPGGANQEPNVQGNTRVDTFRVVRTDTEPADAHHDNDTDGQTYGASTRSGRANPSPNVHEALANGLLSSEEDTQEAKRHGPVPSSSTQASCSVDGFSAKAHPCDCSLCRGTSTSSPSTACSRCQTVNVPPASSCRPRSVISDQSARCSYGMPHPPRSKCRACREPAVTVPKAQSLGNLLTASAGPSANCSFCLHGSAASTASASHIHPAAYSASHMYCCHPCPNSAASASDSQLNHKSCARHGEPKDSCWKRTCLSSSVERVLERRNSFCDVLRGSIQTENASACAQDGTEPNVPESSSFHHQWDSPCGKASCCGEQKQGRTFRKFVVITNKNMNGTGNDCRKRETSARASSPNRSGISGNAVDIIQQGILQLKDQVEKELKEIKSTMSALSSAVQGQASRERSLQELARHLPACSHTSICTASHLSVQCDNAAHVQEPRYFQSPELGSASTTCSIVSSDRDSAADPNRQPSSSVDRGFAHRDCVSGYPAVTTQRSSTSVCPRVCRHCSREVRSRERCCGSSQEAENGGGARLLRSDCPPASRDAGCVDASVEGSGSADGARQARGEEPTKAVGKTLSGGPAEGRPCPCFEAGRICLSDEQLSASAIIQRFEQSLAELSASSQREDVVAHRFVAVSTPPVDVDGYTELSGKNIAPVIFQKFHELKNNNRFVKSETDAVSCCAAAKVNAAKRVAGSQVSSSLYSKPAAHNNNAESKPQYNLKSKSLSDAGKVFTYGCPTATAISSGVVDTAFKVIDYVLKSSNVSTSDMLTHLIHCQRVASSNVDGRDECAQAKSVSSQAATLSKESVDETKGDNSVDRNGYSGNSLDDAANLAKSSATSPKHDDPVFACKSESERSCNKLDPAEECSRASFTQPYQCQTLVLKETDQRTTGTTLQDMKKKSNVQSCDSNRTAERNDCSDDLSTRQEAESPGKSDSENNNKNTCHSRPSECSAFLVCVGKKDGSSAYFIQSLSLPKTTELIDSACQVSDDSTGETAHLADSDRSEASLAWSISPSDISELGRETCRTADNTKRGVRPPRGAAASVSAEGAGFGASLLVSTSAEAHQRSSSVRGPKREISSSTDPVTRVRSLFEGVCEISHSGCETCIKPPTVLSSSEVDDARFLCRRKERMADSDERVSPGEFAVNPVHSHCSLSGLSDDGYPASNVSHEVDPAFQVKAKASELSCASQRYATNSDSIVAAAASTNGAGELCFGSDDGQEGKVIGMQNGSDNDDGVSSVDKPVSCSVNVLRTGNLTPYCAVTRCSGAVEPGARGEDHHGIGTVRAIDSRSSHVDPELSRWCGVDASDAGYSEDNNIVGSASASVDPDFCDTGVADVCSEINHNPTDNFGTGATARNLSLGNDSVTGETTGFDFSPRLVASEGLHTDHCHSNVISRNDGGCRAGKSLGQRPSAPHEHFEPDRIMSGPHPHLADFSSPSSSSSSLSTSSRPTPVSSATNMISSGGRMDPFAGLYTPAWLSTELRLSKSSMGTPPSKGSSGLGLPGRQSRRRRTSDDGASGPEDGQLCPDGFDGGVDVGASDLDGDVATARSQSDEGLWERRNATSSGSKDTWTTLQLLNLSSRATRLALESRLESLHQLLRKIESCEKLSASESHSKQHEAQRCPSNSSNNRGNISSSPPPDENWLMACSSEELIELVNQQLEGLKDVMDVQRQDETSADATDDGQNTNTNYDASASSASDTSTPVIISVGLTASIADAADAGRATFADCFIAVDTASRGVGDEDREVRIDAMHHSDVFRIAQKRHRGVSVGADHGRARVVGFADSFYTSQTMDRGANAENVRVVSFTDSFNTTQELDRGVNAENARVVSSTDSFNTRQMVDRGANAENARVVSFTDSFNTTQELDRGVNAENARVVSSTDSFNTRQMVDEGVNAKKTRVVSFTDSFNTRQTVDRGVNAIKTRVVSLTESFDATQTVDEGENAQKTGEVCKTVERERKEGWEGRTDDTNVTSLSNNVCAQCCRNQSTCVPNDTGGAKESKTDAGSSTEQFYNSSTKCKQAASYSANDRGDCYTCRSHGDGESETEGKEDEAVKQDGASAEGSGDFSKSSDVEYDGESDQQILEDEEGEERSCFEEQEEEEAGVSTVDDAVDDPAGDKASAWNVGVQCNILDDHQVQGGNAGVCGGCHHGLWSFCTASAANHYFYRSACDARPSQLEDAQQELPLLEQCRQRIRSLEHGLQLEKDLHETTRSSLDSLRRDHRCFRSQVFGLHKESGNKTARDRLQDIFRRTEVTGDFCQHPH